MSQISDDIINPGHGSSPAAWTAVIIVLIAFILGSIFFLQAWPAGVIGSAVLAAFGIVLGIILSKLGYGVHGPKFHPKGH